MFISFYDTINKEDRWIETENITIKGEYVAFNDKSMLPCAPVWLVNISHVTAISDTMPKS